MTTFPARTWAEIYNEAVRLGARGAVVIALWETYLATALSEARRRQRP